MRKILIINQPTNNRGDQAAALAMIQGIRKLMPEICIEYLYFSKEYVLEEDDKLKNTHITFEKGGGGYRLIIKICMFCFFNLILDDNVKRVINTVRACNVLVLPPAGPYFGDLYGWREELTRMVFILIAKKLKKKTMIYSPSMGPFSNKIKNFFRKYIFRKVDAITVRDKQSFKNFKKLNVNKNVTLASDSALQNDIGVDFGELKKLYSIIGLNLDNNVRIVGISPIQLGWHKLWKTDNKINDKLIKILSDISDWLIVRHNVRIVFIPQIYGKESDSNIIISIINNMKQKNGVFVLDPEFDTETQQKMLSAMNLIIGCRHHSVVLGIKMLVPSISIAYEYKIESFLEDMSLSDLLIWVDDLNIYTLMEKVKFVQNHKSEIIEKIKTNLPVLRQRAMLNSKLLYDLVA